MKGILIALLALLPMLAVAQSETEIGKTSEERAQQWTEWMKKELSITAEQEPGVQEVNMKYAQKAEELKAREGTKMEKFKELKAIDEAKDGELKSILSEEQFKVYQQKKEARQRKMLRAARS
jgi:hypothetical protein